MADDKVWRVVLVLAVITLIILAVDYGPLAWKWLTSSEDLGMRLRRECETVVREAHPTASGVTREGHVRDCIDARARLVR